MYEIAYRKHCSQTRIVILALVVCMIPCTSRAQIPENNLPFRIGADQSGGNLYKGQIAAVRLYKRALKKDDIAALAKLKPADKAETPVPDYEWLLGQIKKDFCPASVGKLRATVEGDVESSKEGGLSSAEFSGGYLVVEDSESLDFGKGFTVDAWVRPEANIATCRFVDKITPGSADGFLLDIYPANTIRVIVGSEVMSHETDLDSEKWIHLAVTIKDTGGIALYVNGKVVEEN